MAWAQPAASPAPTSGKWAIGTTWYTIKTGHGNYLRSDVLQDGEKLALTNSTRTTEDAGLWCFVGNSTDGYTFYNRATGASAPLAMYGSEADAYALLAENPTDGDTAFDFTKSKKSNGDWWCLKEHGSNNNYWNKRSDRLAYWNSTDAVNGWGNSGAGDDGSALLFEEVSITELEYELTDAVGNVFTGIYESKNDALPTSPGVTLNIQSNDGNKFTATVDYSFPVSKEGGVVNYTTIAHSQSLLLAS